MNKLIFLAVGVGAGLLVSEIYYNIRLDKCLKEANENTERIEALTKQIDDWTKELEEIESARFEMHDTIKETQSEIEDLLSDL